MNYNFGPDIEVDEIRDLWRKPTPKVIDPPYVVQPKSRQQIIDNMWKEEITNDQINELLNSKSNSSPNMDESFQNTFQMCCLAFQKQNLIKQYLADIWPSLNSKNRTETFILLMKSCTAIELKCWILTLKKVAVNIYANSDILPSYHALFNLFNCCIVEVIESKDTENMSDRAVSNFNKTSNFERMLNRNGASASYNFVFNKVGYLPRLARSSVGSDIYSDYSEDSQSSNPTSCDLSTCMCVDQTLCPNCDSLDSKSTISDLSDKVFENSKATIPNKFVGGEAVIPKSNQMLTYLEKVNSLKNVNCSDTTEELQELSLNDTLKSLYENGLPKAPISPNKSILRYSNELVDSIKSTIGMNKYFYNFRE